MTFNFSYHGKIHIQFIFLTMFKCVISGIKYLHIVVQQLPLSISRTFSSS